MNLLIVNTKELIISHFTSIFVEFITDSVINRNNSCNCCINRVLNGESEGNTAFIRFRTYLILYFSTIPALWLLSSRKSIVNNLIGYKNTTSSNKLIHKLYHRLTKDRWITKSIIESAN